MTTCVNCRSAVPEDAAFCPSCGTTRSTAASHGSAGLESISGLGTREYSPQQEAPGSGLQAGEVFHGRYTVVRRLGAGGMGVVYLAEDKVTGKQVVLKLIRPALVQSATAVQRFIREGLTARDVRHPNVIAMHDVGDEGGQLYLVMEYLDGETLRAWLHRTVQAGKEVGYPVARDIVKRILDGLAAAHDAGVIHRDLKPENIMLIGSPEAGSYRLVILDFGIAKAIDTGESAQLTSTSSATGTPLYMAPEQRTIADTVGPPADLYSLTAIFYELLMGVPPEGRLGSPSKERDDVPAGVDGVIEKGLASRPRSRFQSAAEYQTALDEAERHRGVASPKTVPPPQEASLRAQALVGKAASSLGSFKLSRRAWVGVGLAAIVIGIAALLDEDAAVQSTVQPLSQAAAPPATPAAAENVAGTWYVEVQGSGFANASLMIRQSGNNFDGELFDMTGNVIGALSGMIRGPMLNYRFSDMRGGSGSGEGQLRADREHIDVRVSDGATGAMQLQVLHREHLP